MPFRLRELAEAYFKAIGVVLGDDDLIYNAYGVPVGRFNGVSQSPEGIEISAFLTGVVYIPTITFNSVSGARAEPQPELPLP